MLFRFCNLKSDSLVAVRKADIPEVKRLLHGMISFIRIAESRPELRERFEKFCADVSAGRLTEADPDSEACEGDYPFFNAYLALSGELLRLLKPDAEPGAEGEGGEYVSLKFSELTGEMKINMSEYSKACGADDGMAYIKKSDMRRAAQLMRELSITAEQIRSKDLEDTFIRFSEGELSEAEALSEIAEKVRNKHADDEKLEDVNVNAKKYEVLWLFERAVDLDNQLRGLICFDAVGEECAAEELVRMKRCKIADELLDAARNEVLSFKEIVMEISTFERNYRKHFEIKKTENGVEIDYSYSYSRQKHDIKAHIYGGEEFYSAIAHLLAVCKVDEWNQKDWDEGRRCCFSLHGESCDRLYVCFGGDKTLSLNGYAPALPFYYHRFVECLEAIILTPHSIVYRSLSSQWKFHDIDILTPHYKELGGKVAYFLYPH